MEKLIEIKNSYKNQFFKTGNIHFFLMAHKLETLIKNANEIEKLESQENELTL